MIDNPAPSDQPEPKVAKKKVTKASPAPKKTPAAPKKKVAAKKSVNKSQLIRDYAAKHPTAGPTEITRELAKQGIKITPPLVSNVLGASKRKKTKKRVASRKPIGRPAATAADKVSLSDLVATQEFASKVGGVESAKTLLKAIEKLGG